jgi:hypothetical protein
MKNRYPVIASNTQFILDMWADRSLFGEGSDPSMNTERIEKIYLQPRQRDTIVLR